MGKLATFIVALIIGCSVETRAADFLLVNRQFEHVYTNSLSFSATNGVTVTNSLDVSASIYHTFHFVYVATGTNTTSIVTERTIDGSNWVPVITNTLSSTGNSEAQYTGKWVTYRFRATFQNTNAPTLTIPYVAQ